MTAASAGTTFTAITSATSWSGSGNATAATTYYAACKDTAGNITNASVVIRSYTVSNMLLNLNGTKGTYTTANYTRNGSASVYYIKNGTSLAAASICTAPTGGSIVGYKSGAPSTTNASPLTATGTGTSITSNLQFGCWYNRNEYTVTLSKTTNGSVKAETVNQTSNSATATSTASATLTVRYGDTVKATAIPATNYGLGAWSGGYISGGSTPTTGGAVTANKTITATFVDKVYELKNSSSTIMGYAETLASAFANVPAGGTITLLKNNVSGAVANTKNVTLNTNGKSINLTGTLTNGSILTINGGGTITTSSNMNIITSTTGRLTIASVTVTNTNASTNSSSNRGINVTGGSCVINAGAIINITNTYSSHGITVDTATLVMSAGTVTAGGTGIYFLQNSVGTITGGSIVGGDYGIEVLSTASTAATVTLGVNNTTLNSAPIIVGQSMLAFALSGATQGYGKGNWYWYDGTLYGKKWSDGVYTPAPNAHYGTIRTVSDSTQVSGGYKSYLVASKGGSGTNDAGSPDSGSSKNLLSKNSISSASVKTSNSYTTESSCNNACGTTCLKSGNSYICPTYSCDSGVMSGTQCYDY